MSAVAICFLDIWHVTMLFSTSFIHPSIHSDIFSQFSMVPDIIICWFILEYCKPKSFYAANNVYRHIKLFLMPYQGRCYLSGCAVAVPAPGQPGSAESPNPERDPVVLHRGWEPLVLPPKQSKKTNQQTRPRAASNIYCFNTGPT